MLEQRYLLCRLGALGVQSLHLVGQIGVITLDQPIGNHLQQAADFAADLRPALLGDGELAGAFDLRVGRLGDIGFQDDCQALRREQPVGEMPQHHVVERRHGDGASGAVALALLRAAGAGVVTVAPGFAGSDGHAATAGVATGQAGEQCRAVDHAGRVALRVTRLQAGLDLLEILGRDDRRDSGRDPLLLWFDRAGFGAALVEDVLADIGAAAQDTVDAGDLEFLAAEADALAVEPVDDGFDAERGAMPAEGQIKNMPDQRRLCLPDDKALLGLGATALGFLDIVAKGRPGTIPEILAGILAHGAQRVLGVLFGLVLVEQPEELAHQIAGGVVLEGLGEGDDLDAGLAQFADIEFGLELVTEEARHRMDQDDVQRAVRAGGQVDELLEFEAAVIGGRSAGLDEAFRHVPTLAAAEAIGLGNLVGEREVLLRLAGGGDSGVYRDALRVSGN